MKSMRGYSLIEVMIAMGLMTIVIGMGGSFFLYINKRSQKMSEAIDNSIENVVATKELWEDLSLANPSFGSLRLADDFNRDFYDYLPDYPRVLMDEDSRQRVFTLELAGKTSFLLLAADESKGSPVSVEPVKAYNTAPSGNPFAAGPLQYLGLNNKNIISDQLPNAWSNGQLMLLYIPLNVAREDADPVAGYRFSRWPTLMGEVTGNDLKAFNINQYFHNSNPATGLPYLSTDDFLRKVPLAGGAGASVFLRPVRFVRYYLEAAEYRGKPSARLYRTYWTNGSFSSAPEMLAYPVKKVVFKRESVTLPIVSIRIDTEESGK